MVLYICSLFQSRMDIFKKKKLIVAHLIFFSSWFHFKFHIHAYKFLFLSTLLKLHAITTLFSLSGYIFQKAGLP